MNTKCTTLAMHLRKAIHLFIIVTAIATTLHFKGDDNYSMELKLPPFFNSNYSKCQLSSKKGLDVSSIMKLVLPLKPTKR